MSEQFQKYLDHIASYRLEVQCSMDGPTDAKIAIVGEYPGEQEVAFQKPFTGGSGKHLWNVLRRYNILRTDVYTTYAVKRRTTKSFPVTSQEFSLWEESLNYELSQLPNLEYIVCLGNAALEAVLNISGITQCRGSVYDYPHNHGIQVLVANNPALIFRQPQTEIIFAMDMAKLDKLVKGDYQPHYVTKLINTSYQDAMDYLHEAQFTHKKFTMDIESIGMETACIGIGISPNEAMCINFRDYNDNRFTVEQEYNLLRKFLQACDDPATTVIAQNGNFDSYFMGYKDHATFRVDFDTLLAHHTLYPRLPHNLGFLTSQYTNHPYYKDEISNYKEGGDIDTFWQYNCLTGDTKVLLGDLSWKDLADVKIGDTVFAFDEKLQRGCDFKHAKVTNRASMGVKKVIKVFLSNGEIIRGTEDHQIVRRKLMNDGRHAGVEWTTLGELRFGQKIPYIAKPWTFRDDFDGGYMSGIFDGEGTTGNAKGKYPRISFSQKEGKVLQRCISILNEDGIDFAVSEKANAMYVDIRGGVIGTMKALGKYRPERLIDRAVAIPVWAGLASTNTVHILAVVPDGEEEVFDITTEAGTFIANGAIVHNCTDCAITYAIAIEEEKELKDQKLYDFFTSHVMRLQPHLSLSTVTGVAVDMHRKQELSSRLNKQLEIKKHDLQRTIQKLVNDEDLFINPNSPKQVSSLFFDQLKCQASKRSADAATREEIMKDPRTSPDIKDMLTKFGAYAEEHKFVSTYVDTKIDHDNRFRAEFKQYGVAKAPGRLSSSGTLWGSGGNAQNQPHEAYEMYVADNNCVFIYFDLAQAEARYVGWDANIEKWIEDFEKARLSGDFDAHRSLAATMFNKPYDEVPKADILDAQGRKPNHPDFDQATSFFTERYVAKRCRHGLNYRMHIARLAQTTGLSYGLAAQNYYLYHRVNPELQIWWKALEKEAKRTRMQFNCFGRRNYYTERLDSDGPLDSVVAFKPQSSIGDKTQRVWYQCHEDDRWNMQKARIALNVHDALWAIATPDYAMTALSIMKAYAEEPLMIKSTVTGKTSPMIIPADCKISSPDDYGIHRMSMMQDVEVVAASI